MFKGKMILIFMLLSLLLAACGAAEVPQNIPMPTPTKEALQNTPVPTATEEVIPDTPTPAPIAVTKPKPVSFTTSDDLTIGGRLFGEGEKAVILTHMAGCSSQKNYDRFAVELESQGYTVLTFDFRGRTRSKNGIVDCDLQNGLILLDMYAAVEYLQSLGYEDIACIGGSLGGWACLAAGIEVEFSEIVSLSGSIDSGQTIKGVPSTELTEENIPLIKGRKLFVASEEEDEDTVEWAQFFYDYATEPKELKYFSGTAHGTDLLSGYHAKELQEMIFEFLAEK